MSLSPGTRLHDRFTLVERIGAGGMGQVWRATDEVLGRPVAVKVLAARLATNPQLRDATWREARAAARLNHPNVTQVHDYGEVRLPGGELAGYLVMELVEGQSLAVRLASGPLTWPEAARVGRQVAGALAAAHRVGVVHRDVKPGNVMVTGDGVKLLDFGIAARVGADTDPHRLLGTPRYLAPERVARPGPADPASDVYSLGVLLYEALVGRPPPDRSEPPREQSEPLPPDGSEPWLPDEAQPRPPVPGLPAEVAALCTACLAQDPARRPTAEQVAAVLAVALGEPAQPVATVREQAEPAAVPVVGQTVPVARQAVPVARQAAPVAGRGTFPLTRLDLSPPRTRRRTLLAGVAVAALLVGLGVALLVAALRPEPPAPGAQGAPGAASSPPVSAAPDDAGPTTDPTPESGAQTIVHDLDQAVRTAFTAGAITPDAFDDLRDELDKLRDALEEDEPAKRDDKLRKEAQEMRDEVDDLLSDGEINDPATADQLITLLDQLIQV